uniref:GPI transamidase subunit PIG-U n=1 Tax=Auxenochlorella protothecoides TaxID=3075 RepID=A0A1D2A7B9_AUXPR
MSNGAMARQVASLLPALFLRLAIALCLQGPGSLVTTLGSRWMPVLGFDPPVHATARLDQGAWLTALATVLLDFAAAWGLACTTPAVQKDEQPDGGQVVHACGPGRPVKTETPAALAKLYLLHPLLWTAQGPGALRLSIHSAALVISLSLCSQGRLLSAAPFLVVLASAGPAWLAMLSPLCSLLLVARRGEGVAMATACGTPACFPLLSSTLCLAGTAWAWHCRAGWWRGGPGSEAQIRPNLGLQWYLAAEAFPRFRSLYAYVFATLPSVLQSSVALRFPTQPWHVLACQLWLMFLFSDVPAPHHAALAMALSCAAGIPNPGWWLAVLMAGLGLNAAAHHIWLGLGTANANFLYASNLLLAGVVLCHIRALLLQALRRCSPTHAQTQKSLLQQPAPGAGPPGEGAGRRLHKHALRK